MNVVIFTFDMLPSREHLMPWRTIIEVSSYLSTKKNINCFILNSCDEHLQYKNRYYKDVLIVSINKSLNSLSSYIYSNSIDVIYFPFSLRDVFKNFRDLKELNIKKIAYFPGGIYSFSGVLALWKKSNLNATKSYLLEVFIPKFLLTLKLKRLGFSKLITMCTYTSDNLNSVFWKNTVDAIPGNDDFSNLQIDDSIIVKYQLNNKKFFLFTGSVAPIRGSINLLNAFSEIIQKNFDVHLVLLIRKDINVNSKKFYEELENIRKSTHVTIIHENISREQIKCFFQNAYVVVLPFLLIPSEIPLTFFEVLSCGTPIITFRNGGTFQYVKQCCIGVNSRSSSALAKSMEYIWNNEEHRKILSLNALSLMKDHLTWENMAEKWYDSIKSEM